MQFLVFVMITCVSMMILMCNDCMCVTTAYVKIVLLMCYMCDIFVMVVYMTIVHVKTLIM